MDARVLPVSPKQIDVALLLTVLILMATGCNPNNASGTGDNARASSPEDISGDAPAASDAKNGLVPLSPSEPPVTRIECYDMAARKAGLAAHQQLRYGTRTEGELLRETDPRYQTVAGAIDAIFRQRDESGRYRLRFAVPELIDMDPRFLSCNGILDVQAKLKGDRSSSKQAMSLAREQVGKTHVTIQVEQPGSVLETANLLVATESLSDADLMGLKADALRLKLKKEFITPEHPIDHWDLTLTTIAELDVDFVDADGNTLTKGNVYMTGPFVPTRRLNGTRNGGSVHHFENVATSSQWRVSTIAIGGTIDYLERPIIQLPEPGLWKVTFQVLPSPIIATDKDQLWELTKAERIGNRGTERRPVERSQLVTLRVVKVTKPDGSIVDPAFINRPSP